MLSKLINYIKGDTGVTSRGFLHFTPTPQPTNSQQNNFNLASIGPRNSQRHSLNQVSPAPNQSQRHLVPSGAKLFNITNFVFLQLHEME